MRPDTLLPGQLLRVVRLPAGAASAGAANVTIPADTPIGTYELFAKAHGLDQLAESLENNNTTSPDDQIGGDPVVTSLTAPAMAGAGTVIPITDTTTNQGTATVAASTTRFYLSANWQLPCPRTPSSMASRRRRSPPGSGPSTSTLSLTIPTGTLSGGTNLLAVADAAGVVAETSESDNTESRGIQVGTDPVVDLHMPAPAKGGAGVPLAITGTTQQSGHWQPRRRRSTRYFPLRQFPARRQRHAVDARPWRSAARGGPQPFGVAFAHHPGEYAGGNDITSSRRPMPRAS